MFSVSSPMVLRTPDPSSPWTTFFDDSWFRHHSLQAQHKKWCWALSGLQPVFTEARLEPREWLFSSEGLAGQSPAVWGAFSSPGEGEVFMPLTQTLSSQLLCRSCLVAFRRTKEHFKWVPGGLSWEVLSATYNFSLWMWGTLVVIVQENQMKADTASFWLFISRRYRPLFIMLSLKKR